MPGRSYEFGRFRVDASERTLLRDGREVALTQKAFDVLLALVERSGRVVGKDELMQRVWPDQFVEEGNLTQNVYTLRKILGETEGGDQYIQTVPRRGYRFAGVVRETAGDGEADATPTREAQATADAAETFVGREQELARLARFFERAVGGSGKIVFVTGEPGMGKTALCDEYVRRARAGRQSAVFARGHCVEQYGASEAYLPVLEAFGELLRGGEREPVRQTLRTHAPTWCLQFPSAFDSAGERELLRRETVGATKERMLREMGDCLAGLAERTPFVLLLEDLHWADSSTVDLLRHLGNRAGSQRLLVVGTYRPEGVEVGGHPLKNSKREMEAHGQCEEVALGALGREQVEAYLGARFHPNDFPPRLPDLILRKTHGHPLFATRLVQFLAERGDITKKNSHWSLARELSEVDIETPESVLSMIRGRIEALDETDRRALQHASVAGEEFLSTVVAGSLGADLLEVEERLDRLARAHRLIRARGEEELPDGSLTTRYSFSHALYQNVLYGDMVSQRRRELHVRAGRLLEAHYAGEAHRVAAQLTMHFERGRDFARAVRYLTLVGDNAARVYANAEAAEHYTRALELAGKLPAGERAESLMSLRLKRGSVESARSRFEQAHEDFTKLIDEARAASAPETEQAALNGLIRVLFFSRRLDEVPRRTEEALALAARTGNEALRLETLAFVVQKHIRSREYAEAVRLAEQIIADAGRIGHSPALLSGLVERGELHFQVCEYALADELLGRAAALASETGDGFMRLYSLFFLGLVAGNTGRMSRALGHFGEAEALAALNGDRFWLARLPSMLGWIHRELHDFDGALGHDRRGLEVARAEGLPEVEANALLNFCQEHARRGESDEWVRAFREIEEVIERNPWMRPRYHIRLQSLMAEYWLAMKDYERADDHARLLVELTTKHELHKDVSVARLMLAEAAAARGLPDEAEAQLASSLAVLEKYPAPLVAWRVHAALGRLSARRGDTPSARAAHARARRVVEEIAAGVEDERLRNIFLTSAAVRDVLDHDE